METDSTLWHKGPEARLLRRRGFLAGSLGALALCTGRRASEALAADTLHVLRPQDFERLRLDFNASRSKVRLILLLSPT